MNRKMLSDRLQGVIIGVLIGFLVSFAVPVNVPQQTDTAPASAPQQVDVDLDTSRLDAIQGMGALMQSQCFWPTDTCCEYAHELVRYTPEDGSAETYLQHLDEMMHFLVETGCIEPTDGCLEFAWGLVEEPVERSVFTYPLPHEGE